MKWCQARLGGRLFGRTMLYKQFNYFDSILFAGNVQGRKAVESARVKVWLLIQEKLGYFNVTTMSGHV